MVSILLIAALASQLLNLAHSTTVQSVLYVTAPDGALCPVGTVCHNISYYMDHSRAFLTDNTIINFMEGTHDMEGEELVEINGVSNLAIVGLGVVEQGFHETVAQASVIIDCNNFGSGLLVTNSSNITIRGLTITNCGGLLPPSLPSEVYTIDTLGFNNTLSSTSVALGLLVVHNVLLQHVSIHNSTGYGVFGINAFNVSISDSSFAANNLYSYFDADCSRLFSNFSCFGGNTALFYTATNKCPETFTSHFINVIHSNFSFGINYGIYSIGGLGVYMQQADQYGINTMIQDSIFYGNTGTRGANIRYVTTTTVHHHFLRLHNVTSVYANAIYPLFNIPDRIIYGTGLNIYVGFDANQKYKSTCFSGSAQLSSTSLISISNGTFSHNIGTYGAGMWIDCGTASASGTIDEINMDTIEMRNNSGVSGSNLFLTQDTGGLLFASVIKNMAIYDAVHRDHVYDVGPETLESAVLIHRMVNTTFINVSIYNCEMSALVLLSAVVYFQGTANHIVNNAADNGGGIQSYGDSTMVLRPPVHVSFINNTAFHTGGAIFVSGIPFIRIPCFFSVFDPSFNPNPLANVTMSGNTALIAGSALYGGNVDNCYLTSASIFTFNHIANSALGTEAFDYIFNYQEEEGLSVLSSDAKNLCFCVGNIPDCSIEATNATVLPGEPITVSIVGIGQRLGTTHSIITFREATTDTGLQRNIFFEPTISMCSNITYMPNIEDNETLPSQRVIEMSVTAEQMKQKAIYVNIQECPLGFEFSPTKGTCDCSPAIQELEVSVSCHASTATLSHSGDVWIGYDASHKCILTSSDCYSAYCLASGANFTVMNGDLQCDSDRSGYLCGQCAEGLSLMLGSERCGKCTNWSVLLFIPFSLAGFLLIGLITFLNLTVSTGFINGLIFYANILKINEAIFFPEGPIPFLSQFISWINLDFGIKACFYDGLTGFGKTWLQFLFPLYLWVIVIFIIVAARYSSKIAKLMGRQAVPVLATVILLSFTKLFRTCIQVWKRTIIKCDEKIELQLWAFDPNISYTSGRYWVLFVFAFLLFWLTLVPFTLLILLGPLIEKYLSKYRVFKWWFKLKPLFDAYGGPYEDKYRFWTGLLLLARLVLVQIFAFASDTIVTDISVITVVSILLGLLGIMSSLYRYKILDWLECFFLINIIFVALSTFKQEMYNSISVSISLAFLAFVAIVIYHILLRFKLIDKLKPVASKISYRSKLSRKFNGALKMSQTVESSMINSYVLDISPTTGSVNIRLGSITQEVEGMQRGRYREGSVFVQRKRETLLHDDGSQLDPESSYYVSLD